MAEPSADALPSNASACALDLPFVLEWPAQAQDAVGSWQWTVDSEGTNAVGHGLSQEGTYTIEVRDNATGCFDTQSVALNVLPNLFLDASVVDPLICRGDSTEIVVEVFTLEGLDAFELPVFLNGMPLWFKATNPLSRAGSTPPRPKTSAGPQGWRLSSRKNIADATCMCPTRSPRWRWAQRGLQGAHGMRIRHV